MWFLITVLAFRRQDHESRDYGLVKEEFINLLAEHVVEGHNEHTCQRPDN